AIAAAFLTQVLAKKLVGVGMQDTHVQLIPLHLHRTSDPSRRQTVIGGFDFHTTIQMHYTFSVLVVAERFQRQCLQVRFFFREHGGTWRLVVPWMRVSAQRSSQRSRYACASSRLSKRIPLIGVLFAWPTPDSTFPLRSGSWVRQGSATTP